MQRRSCVALVAAVLSVLAWAGALVSCLLAVAHLAVTLAMSEPEATCTHWHSLWRRVECDVDLAGHWRSAGWARPWPWLLGTALLAATAWALRLADPRRKQPAVPRGDEDLRMFHDSPDGEAGPTQLPSPP